MRRNLESTKLQTVLRELKERFANASIYFNDHPELTTAQTPEAIRLREAFDELQLRIKFVEYALELYAWIAGGRPTTNEAKRKCLELTSYAVSPYMYPDNSEAGHKYAMFVADMRALYPEWETRDLVYITHNINLQATMRGDSDRYYRAFRTYIEKTTEYYLWLREMYCSISAKGKPKITLDERAKTAFQYVGSFAGAPVN